MPFLLTKGVFPIDMVIMSYMTNMTAVLVKSIIDFSLIYKLQTFWFWNYFGLSKLYNFRPWNKIMTYYDELQRSVCHQILVKAWGKRGNGCFCPLTDYSASVAHCHWTIYCPRLPIVRLILTFSDPFLASSIVYHGNGKLKVIYIKKNCFYGRFHGSVA